MNQHCICNSSSEENSEDQKEEKMNASDTNRICLNFTRKYHHPPKNRQNQIKVKELFKYLHEREDLQEMKASGWSDENEEGSSYSKPECDDEEGRVEEAEEEEGLKDGMESFYDEDSIKKGGGQRFAMSRDFWYRKLNTLKAQKLDEAALEAEDIPALKRSTSLKYIKYLKSTKIYADELEQKKEDIFMEIDKFENCVAKPVEKKLKTKFINVYDNHNYFRKQQGCPPGTTDQ